MEDKIDRMLDLYSDLEELFEVLDIEPQEVLRILLKGGHVKLPDFLEEEFDAAIHGTIEE